MQVRRIVLLNQATCVPLDQQGGCRVQGLLRLSKGIDAFTEFVGNITIWLVPIVVGIGVWNVGNRYIGLAIGRTLGSNLYIEAQWYVFSVIFLMGGSYALKHGEHVRVDVFYGMYSPQRKAWVDLLGTFLFLIPFCLLLIYFTLPYVQNSWRILEGSPDGSAGLPRYPLKTFILVSPVLLIIQGISEAIKNAAFLMGYSDSTGTGKEHSAMIKQGRIDKGK
nr:TRAP transporter small permease subunit [Candidatus Chloroploca mongolica]